MQSYMNKTLENKITLSLSLISLGITLESSRIEMANGPDGTWHGTTQARFNGPRSTTCTWAGPGLKFQARGALKHCMIRDGLSTAR